MNEVEHVLVVAERAADPVPLIDMLSRRAHASQVAVTLLVPATLHGLDWAGDPRAGITDAALYAERLRRRLATHGVEVLTTLVGDPDPRAATEDVLGAHPFAEVVISRPPKRVAHLLRVDLPQRLEQATDAPVTYVRAGKPAPRRWRSPIGREPRRPSRRPRFRLRRERRTLHPAPHSR